MDLLDRASPWRRITASVPVFEISWKPPFWENRDGSRFDMKRMSVYFSGGTGLKAMEAAIRKGAKASQCRINAP
jgi:hypothetical protein